MLVDKIAATRATYWAALVAVHSVFLAVAFALMVAGGKWAGWQATLFAWSSAVGLLLPLLGMGSVLSHLQELHRKRVSGKPLGRFGRWYSAQRPRVWSLCEQASTLLVLPCLGVILWYMGKS